MAKIFASIVLILICHTTGNAQLQTEKTTQQLAIDVFDAYGARQNFANALNGQIKNFKAQNPSIPQQIIENFVKNATDIKFFSLLAKPISDRFSKDELIELVKLFTLPGCQKALNPKSVDSTEFSDSERKDLEILRNSEVGEKFSKEWPSIKNELSLIAKKWLADSYGLAVSNYNSSNRKTK